MVEVTFPAIVNISKFSLNVFCCCIGTFAGILLLLPVV